MCPNVILIPTEETVQVNEAITALRVPEGFVLAEPLNGNIAERVDVQTHFWNFLTYVGQEISKKVENYKSVSVIFPANGAIPFYYYLMQIEDTPLLKNECQIVFAAHEGPYLFNRAPTKGSILIVEDMFDLGGTLHEINAAIRRDHPVNQERSVTMIPFTHKANGTKIPVNVNLTNSLQLPDRWITSGIGLNSGFFGPEISVLERLSTSFLYLDDPEGISRARYEQKPDPIDAQAYRKYLLATSLIDGDFDHPLYQLLLNLERMPNLNQKLLYLYRYLHTGELGF